MDEMKVMKTHYEFLKGKLKHLQPKMECGKSGKILKSIKYLMLKIL